MMRNMRTHTIVPLFLGVSCWCAGSAQGEVPTGVLQGFEHIGAGAAFAGDGVQDAAWVLARLQGDADPVGAYARTRLGLSEQQLRAMSISTRDDAPTKRVIAAWLNGVANDAQLYDAKRFEHVRLSGATRLLLKKGDQVSPRRRNTALLLDWLGQAYRSPTLSPRQVGEKRLPFGTVAVYELSGYEVCWDRDEGRIASVTCPYPSIRGAGLPSAVLRANVASLAQWLGEDLADWSSESCRVFDHGSGGMEHVWVFRRLSEDGVQLPSLLTVAMTSDGQLTSLVRFVVEPTVALQPGVSLPQAVGVVHGTWPDWELRNSSLRVQLDRDGRQALVWGLSGTDGGGDRFVMVDAHRGTIVRSVTPSGSSDDGAPDAAAVSAPRGPVSTTTKVGLLGLAALLAAALWWVLAAGRRRPGISGPEAGS